MWSPVYYRRVAMLHLVRKWCRGTRVSRRRVTCVSGLTEVSVRREGASQSPHEAALYIHWPYCLRRCSYCNFNKYINAAVNQAKLRECLQREAHTLLQLSQVSCITSVFFGGGTPSLAPPSTIAAVLETVAKHAHIPCDAEVTLEVNPTPAQTACLGNFMLAGVNRFSIGVQSLNDEDLKVLGRDHTCHDAFHILAEAQRLCPGRVSVDLIFGRPGQSLECWEKELEELLAFCDDHVSLYQLTLERGTQLFRQVQEGILTTPDDEAAAHMYEAARDVLQKHGFLQYEVSNFARNGAVSQHNLNYWMCGQYLGVGPGAHGRFVPHGEGGVLREARTQTLEPDVWMKEVQLWGHGTRRRIMLHQLALLEEVLAMGLRITEGISHQLWSGFSPAVSLQQIVGRSPEVQELQERKLIVLDERGLRCSREGLALLDSLLPLLLLELQAHVNQQESAG